MSRCLDDAREHIARDLQEIKDNEADNGIRLARAIALETWKFWPNLDVNDLIQMVREEALRIGVRGIF